MARRKRVRSNLWFDMARMTMDASQVIPLRLMKIAAGGPRADRESRLMVSEKMAAAATAGWTLALGGSPEKVVRQYRRKVGANRKRLSK